MKLRTRLLSYTAAIALTAGAAFAAIDGNQLADDYLAEGYTFVEVKVGPTQTKVEAIKGDSKVEVIYDNETLEIIKKETETADGDDVGRTGKQVRKVDRDFEDDGDGDDDEDDHDDDDD
ncbi:MAG: PepSY domain-containing protein, partial [Paracoccaceae bacterium]